LENLKKLLSPSEEDADQLVWLNRYVSSGWRRKKEEEEEEEKKKNREDG